MNQVAVLDLQPEVGGRASPEQNCSRSLLFSSGDPKVVSFQTDLQLGQPAAYASPFAQRHGNGGNLVFFNGHAEWFLGSRVVEVNPNSLNRGYAKWPQTDIIWTRAPYMNPNNSDDPD